MRTMKPWAYAILCLGLAAPPVLADDDCEASVQQWQSRDAVMQMAAQQGWQVQRLKIDDGCYEIRGRNAQGQAFKARIDPKTLKIVKRTKRDDDHERARKRNGEWTQGQPPQNTGANAPPVSSPGNAAPGQTE